MRCHQNEIDCQWLIVGVNICNSKYTLKYLVSSVLFLAGQDWSEGNGQLLLVSTVPTHLCRFLQHHTTCIGCWMDNSRWWSPQCFTGENVCWPLKNSRSNFYGTLLLQPRYVYRSWHMYRDRTTGHLHKSKLFNFKLRSVRHTDHKNGASSEARGPRLVLYITIHTACKQQETIVIQYTQPGVATEACEIER